MSRLWNPRYVLYANAHGRTPEAQQAHDRAEQHAGAFAMPYMLWIQGRWREFRALSHAHAALVGDEKHAAFDAWLGVQYGVTPPSDNRVVTHDGECDRAQPVRLSGSAH